MRSATTRYTRSWLAWLATAALIAVLWPPGTPAGESTVFRSRPVDQWHTNRIIVKWRASGVAAVQMDRVEDRAARLSQSSGLHFTPARNLFGRTDVMLLDYIPTHSEMQDLLGRLNADPSIEYAEPDGVRFIQQAATIPAMPNDPHFYASTNAINDGNPDASIGSWVGQWYLLPSSSTTPAAIDATDAWALSTGTGITVAIIDTGINATHVDLVNQMLPSSAGYDFVSCDQGNFQTTTTNTLGSTQGIDQCTAGTATASYFFSNENENWNPDGSDPGDYITADDLLRTEFKDAGCTATADSSWHGTQLAGVIGAETNNGKGIAGVAPSVQLVSARVVGSCRGALVSDLATAILWASGQAVPISTGNISLSPGADILNISLGATTPCSNTEQDAINAALTAGAIIVAAAGNEGGPLDAPANCTGVVSVVGLRQTGDKVAFSNLGSADLTPTIAAPGGNCVNLLTTDPCLYDIETTTDPSTTTPTNQPDFYTYALFDTAYLQKTTTNPNDEQRVGTSYAAPMVAGVAALMKSSNPKLTAGQIIARMQSSALPFPTTSPGSTPKPTSCDLADDGAASGGNFTEPTTPVACLCTTVTCGAGMLNAVAAVNAANAAFVQIIPSSTTGIPGQKISLDGSASTAAKGHTIASYQWTTDPVISDQLINPNAATATLVVPSFRSIGVTLTITDDAGTQTSGSVTIQSAFDAGHSGGALQPEWLAALAALTAWQLYRRRPRRGC